MWVCVWYMHVCGGECGGEGAGTRVWCEIQYPLLLSTVFGDKVSYWTWSLTYRGELPQSVVCLGRTPCVLEWAQQEFAQPLLGSPYHGYFTTVGSFVPYRNTCCCFDGLWILSLRKASFQWDWNSSPVADQPLHMHSAVFTNSWFYIWTFEFIIWHNTCTNIICLSV